MPIVLIRVPVAASHSFIVVSRDPETIRLPSGLKQTERTQLMCPVSVLISLPFWEFHIFIVLSAEPEIILLPSRLNWTVLTHIEWLRKVLSSRPVDISNNLIVPPPVAKKICQSLGLKPTE